MSKIDHPMFKKVGAFWIEGRDEPFYGLHEAKNYQHDQGGDILNYRGEVIIHQPDEPAVVEEVTNPVVEVHKKKKGFWNLFGMFG